MKLPAIPFLTKTAKTEFFLALIFEVDKISGILFREQNKTLNILAAHEFKVDLEDSAIEELIKASDSVISRLEVSLPEGSMLEKTIFSVPHFWVDEGRIKVERLSQLKKISTELALSPVGFIVSIEAIVVFLQKKEGAPVNGIFISVSSKFLEIFIVRGGNIIEIKKGEIGSEGVEKTVEKLLESVEKLEVLPSKIVLLHNSEGEKNQQKFLSYHWTKNLPFQHLPQVEILDRGFENEAIINGVAQQMGAQIKNGFSVTSDKSDLKDEEYAEVPIDSFGFVKEKDVKIEPAQVIQEEKREDIEIHHHGDVDAGEEIYEDDYNSQEEGDRTEVLKKSLPAILTSIIPKRISFVDLFTKGKSLVNRRSLFIPLAALVVVAVLLIGYYSYILKAQVVIFTDQKEFKDSLGITLTTSGNSSFADKTLKIETLTEEVSGEDSQETTGTLETGEKAAGELTIFNKTEGSKTLAKGSIIVSSNGLEYQVNEDIKLASTSSFATTFSSQKTKITASKFGKEYNIPSGTNFTIKGVSTSDLFAKNDSAFSGGTKEEIQIVSLKDIQILSDTMTKRHFEKAKKQANEKLESDEALIPVMLSSKFKEQKFDKKEKDKATSLKLNATVTYTLGVYKKDELGKFISSSDDFDVPDDFQLADEESEIVVSDVKQNKNDISAKLSFSAIFKPKIDINKIPEMVKGRGKNSAEEKIKAISGVSDVTVILINKLPVLPTILPLSVSNILVEIKTQ